VGRLRFNEEEVRELRRGLLLRMREFLEEGKILHAPALRSFFAKGFEESDAHRS
jgi:hypothetical protein